MQWLCSVECWRSRSVRTTPGGNANPARRQQEDEQLSETIQRVHAESRQRYSSPRIHAELQAQGIRCGRKRVARLMRRAGLRGKCKWRRHAYTRDSKHKLPVAENMLKQDFTAEQPNAKSPSEKSRQGR